MPLYYVVAQDYHDFRVIYVDDCSSDRTGELVEQFIADRSSGNLIHLIRSPVRIGALQNLYNTFTCAMMTVVLSAEMRFGATKKVGRIARLLRQWTTLNWHADLGSKSRMSTLSTCAIMC
jgi:glycosyltransferase involved in cell wall biosynthesis